jgi:hypothetical protein
MVNVVGLVSALRVSNIMQIQSRMAIAVSRDLSVVSWKVLM